MSDEVVVIGAVAGVWGVKGWVKLLSFTEPRENISAYLRCLCNRGAGWQDIEFDAMRPQGKSMIGHIVGVDDRDAALAYRGAELGIATSELPALAEGEYYWHQLIGLDVMADYDGETRLLGRVERMMATGANDVMVVQPTDRSIDARERLIPWAPGVYIAQVDEAKGEITVRWDPEF